jgi:hypothetical protein
MVLMACHDGGPGLEETAPAAGAARSAELGFEASVALVATAPDGATSALYWVDSHARELPAPWAVVEHARGAMVRAALLEGDEPSVAIVADASTPRDRSFAAALFVARPDGRVERLIDGVVHASRPLAASDGSIVVSRGEAGLEGAAGRIDGLSLDAIEPATGRARPLASFSAFTCFVAGELDGEVIAYVVDEAGASLVGVALDGRGVRLIAELAPFARDFTVDELRRAVVFTDRAPEDPKTWQVLRVDVSSGALEVVHEGPSMLLVPTLLSGGAVALHERGSTRVLGAEPLGVPVPGVLRILGRSAGDRVLAGLATQEGSLAVPVVLSGDGARSRALPSPSGARVTIAGVIERGAP